MVGRGAAKKLTKEIIANWKGTGMVCQPLGSAKPTFCNNTCAAKRDHDVLQSSLDGRESKIQVRRPPASSAVRELIDIKRALHTDLVSDQSSKGFLLAYKRFTALRGHPKKLWSDPGNNFVGARPALKELYLFLDQLEK
ncbi:hypothetical protein QQF64_018601 [Cirrhinus molitorella]|uniref:Uncharacterized protein n=1 Tax=Cirrhinus molitorella TaxID=172907 RepID=A0ABR3LD41_9TELE